MGVRLAGGPTCNHVMYQCTLLKHAKNLLTPQKGYAREKTPSTTNILPKIYGDIVSTSLHNTYCVELKLDTWINTHRDPK